MNAQSADSTKLTSVIFSRHIYDINEAVKDSNQLLIIKQNSDENTLINVT